MHNNIQICCIAVLNIKRFLKIFTTHYHPDFLTSPDPHYNFGGGGGHDLNNSNLYIIFLY